MMMLANTDQEEFMYQMREAFLDSGKAIEDMTLAEKKLAAQQMGMDIGEFETFMDPDREVTDTATATAEAALKTTEDAMDILNENMNDIEMTGDRMAQILKDKAFSVISEDAFVAAQSVNMLKNAFVTNVDEFMPGYTELLNMQKQTMEAIVLDPVYAQEMKTQLQNFSADLIGNEEAQKRIQQTINQSSINMRDLGELAFDLRKIEGVSEEDLTKILGMYSKIVAQAGDIGVDIGKNVTEGQILGSEEAAQAQADATFNNVEVLAMNERDNVQDLLDADPLEVKVEVDTTTLDQTLEDAQAAGTLEPLVKFDLNSPLSAPTLTESLIQTNMQNNAAAMNFQAKMLTNAMTTNFSNLAQSLSNPEIKFTPAPITFDLKVGEYQLGSWLRNYQFGDGSSFQVNK